MEQVNFGKEKSPKKRTLQVPRQLFNYNWRGLVLAIARPPLSVRSGNQLPAARVSLTGPYAQSLEVLRWMHEPKSVGRPRTRRDSRNATGNRRLNLRAALKPSKLNRLPANRRGENGCARIGS